MPSIYKYNLFLPQFFVVDNFFNKEEVEKIIDLEDLQNFSKGKVGDVESTNLEHRDSDISWLHQTPNSDWLFSKFSSLVGQVNHSHFMYDIDGFEAFQYTKYKTKQHYDWHFDIYTQYVTFERKISAVILLTEPEKYKGGELEVVVDGNINKPVVLRPGLGSVVFFASWMPHRVAPVKSGVRKSLVAWVMGKRAC